MKRSNANGRPAREPENLVFPAPGEKAARKLNLRNWYVQDEGCEQVARRVEVWSLLGWYHEQVVQPQLGFRGLLRRLWRILTGQRWKLMGPWETMRAQRAVLAMAAEQEAARQRAEAEAKPTTEPAP